jgi:aryl-alcohol dehydrogenase-like predicted oxidoreductase
MKEFLYSDIPVVNKKAFRLGLSTNFGIETDGIQEALEDRMNYIFWTPTMKKATPVLKEVLKKDRERYILATGPTTAWWSNNIRRFTEKTLSSLKIDYLDILQIHWLGVTSAWNDGISEELEKLRDEGKTKAIGISIHNRERAGILAKESSLNSFMIRYNAAHPGAEKDIFPHINKEQQNVTAYTATRWRKLLKRPKGWEGKVPTAGDCYRFCLSNNNVNVVLSGPKNKEQYEENIKAIEKGPLTDEEMKWMREFGKVVHG